MTITQTKNDTWGSFNDIKFTHSWTPRLFHRPIFFLQKDCNWKRHD